MAQKEQQTSWQGPNFTIDCVLAKVSGELEADGCVLERLEGEHKSGYKLTTPDQLTAGDFVKVQLWLEGEEAFIDIRLAEVKIVHTHWITVEVIVVSPNDRRRLKELFDGLAARHIEKPTLISHLLIRA